MKHGPQPVHVPAPILTLQAFAVELYLKFLIAAESKPAERGHGLVALFEQLEISSKDSIGRSYTRLSSTDPVTSRLLRERRLPDNSVEACLRMNDKNFVRWRYIFEPENLPKPGEAWYLDLLLQAVQERSKEVYHTSMNI